MTFFKNFYKPIKQVLSDGYNEDKVTFNLKTKAKSGLGIEFQGVRQPGKDITGTLQWNQEFKQEHGKYKVNGKMNLQGTIDGEVQVSDFGQKGLTLGFQGKLLSEHTKDEKLKATEAEEDRTDRDTAGINVTYENKNFNFTAQAIQKRLNPFRVALSSAVHYEGLSVGGEAVINAFPKPTSAQNAFKDYAGGLNYKTDSVLFSFLLEKKATRALIGFRQDINKDLAVAVEFAQNLQKSTKTPEPGKKVKRDSVFTAGVQYRKDDAVAKLKINSNGTLAGSYQVKLSKDVTTTFSGEIEDITDSKTSTKFGLNFTYEPKE